MNQEKFQRFSEVYRIALEEAVVRNPQKYLMGGTTAAEYADVVSKRIFKLISEGKHMSINYDSDGFKLACKALGFKLSRKAILEYLEIK